MPRRILVVDDEPQVVELLAEILGDLGFEVEAAGNASGALDLVRTHIFDAAILDFNLPDMDAVMLHRQIRQMDTELAERTLFMSGLEQPDSNIGYFSTQGSGYLCKPFKASEVVESLNNLWASEADADASDPT